MKKKSIVLSVIVLVASLLLSAAISIGTLLLVEKKNVEETGNVLGVSWYNENEKEFTISTKEEFIELSKLSNYYTFKKQTIKLDADIVLNEGNAEEWAVTPPSEKWSPIRNFAGTFDGQGHTISGLYAKSYEAAMGLFANTNNECLVTDLRLVNSYFETSGAKGVASFVGNGGGKFTKLYSDAIFDHKGESVGGIGGYMDEQSVFEECWFDGKIRAIDRYVGGIVAASATPRVEIKHSLFSGIINHEMSIDPGADVGGSNNTKTGGIVGVVRNGAGVIVEDSLSSGSLTLKSGNQMGSVFGVTETSSDNKVTNVYASEKTYSTLIGAKGGTNNGGPVGMAEGQLNGVEAYRWTELDFDNYWSAIEGKTPELKYFAKDALDLSGIVKAYDKSWYNKDNTMFTITTKEQLYGLWYLSCETNFADKIVSLGADITVNTGKASDWAKKVPELKWNPIGTFNHFAGTFDGKGHTISGIYVNVNTPYAGLFGHTALNSTIKNLKLTNSYIASSSTHVGSVVGHSYGSIDSVYSDAIIDVKGEDVTIDMVGGITGVMDYQTKNYRYKMNLTNCWYDGTIIAAGKVNNIGGIVGSIARYGSADGTKIKVGVSHCLFTGKICDDTTTKLQTSINNVGGILGAERQEMLVDITDTLSAGTIDIQGTTTSNGAVVGKIFKAKSVYTMKDVYATLSSCSNKAPGKGIGSIMGEPNGGVAILPDEWLTDKVAYQYSSLDFKDYWTTVAKSTPELRTFAAKTQNVSGLKKLADQSWYDDSKKEMVIDSVEDLYGFYVVSAFDNFKGQTVKLGKDIVVNSGNAADWATKAPEKIWLSAAKDNYFAGTFDGQGHAISGLYINTDSQTAGFIGRITADATVKNFKIVNSYMKTTSTHAGMVVGHANGKVDSVYSDAIIEANGNGYFIGGIVGVVDYYTSDLKYKQYITNCWFDGTIRATDGKQGIGGIVGALAKMGSIDGKNTKVYIEHCLNTGTITATKKNAYVGGILGCDWAAMTFEVNDCLNVGKVSGSNTEGAIIGRVKNNKSDYKLTNAYATNDSCSLAGYGTKLPNVWLTDNKAYEYTYLDFAKYWTTVKNSTPELRTFAANVQTASGEKKLDISWYDAKKNTFELKDLADLYGFYLLSANNSFKGKTIKLGADIVVNAGDAATFATSAPVNEWMPIGTGVPFAGTFDGKGHSISGLYINSTTAKTGLFGYTDLGSVVKNLKLVNSYIKTNSTHAGSVIGHAYGSVESVYSDAIIDATGAGYFIGGIVGVIDYQTLDYTYKQSITNCQFDGRINVDGSKEAIGGIVGATAKYGSGDAKKSVITIAHCLNTGTISATSGNKKVAGIVGCDWTGLTVKIDDCLNVGGVTGAGSMGAVLGGTAPKSTIKVTDSFATKSSCSSAGNAVLLPDEWLKGNAAFEYSYLDFDNYWTTVENSTPELRSFAGKVQTATGEKKLDVSWYDADAKELVISDAKDLYGFYVLSATENFAGQTIKMDKDIVLNEGNSAEWTTKAPENEWFPASNAVPFAGTFDGQGHAISGMYINQTAAFAGFISKTDYGSMIKNLKLVNGHLKTTVGWCGSVVGKSYGSMNSVYSDMYITSTGGIVVGGLVGDLEHEHVNDFEKYRPTFTQCWYNGVMNVYSDRVGGFAGQAFSVVSQGRRQTVEFTDCLVTGTLNNTKGGEVGTGGFIGRTEDITIQFNRCISGIKMNVAPMDKAAGSFVGRFPSARTVATWTNCYATTEGLAGNKIYGMAADGAVSSASTCTFKSESAFAGLDGYNLLKDIYSISTKKSDDTTWMVTGGVPELMKYSNNAVDMGWYYNNPDATEFVIRTADELYALGYISQTTNFAGKTIKLANDIVLNKGKAEDWKAGKLDGVRKWKSIGSNAAATQFKGTFDGQGHTISGLYGTYSVICQGMFATIGQGGVAKNFRLVNSYQTSTTGYFGGIVGRSDGGAISKVYSDGYVIATGVWNNGTNPMYVGGIAGTMIGTTDGKDDIILSEVWFAGTVESASMRNGGLIGGVNASNTSSSKDVITLQDCIFTGTMKSTNGKHTSGYGTAGILGCMTTNSPVLFKNCIAVDDVTCTGNQFKGAILGASSHYTNTNVTLTNCYVIGNKVAPVAIATHSAFTGKINGSATVVSELKDAKTIATVSSAWTTVEEIPVLKEFEDLVPKTETTKVNLFKMLKNLFTGKEN